MDVCEVLMIVRDARNAARTWVLDEASELPGFHGALYHGSVVSMPDDSPVEPTSDVDIVLVVDDPEAQRKLGKFAYRGVLLEASFIQWKLCRSPELILANYTLAGTFRSPGVILDPSGELTRIQKAVAKDYAKRNWVLRRCENARDKVLGHLRSLDQNMPFHDQVTAWLFGTGVTTHVLLVAGSRNPTVRKRYLAARELLADYGHASFYETLLELLGCAQMTQVQVERHLAPLSDAFDAACAVIKTPFFFSADISEAARPIAIDGSRELVDRGDHREAIFWIVATYARCQKVLYHDAPSDVYERHEHGFRELLGDLGIASLTDMTRRRDQVLHAIPEIWEVAEAIINANPEIEG